MADILQTTPEQPALHDGSEDCGKCDPCKTARRQRRIYRLKLMVGTLLPFLLGSLDLTVVATALPFIASHFDQTSQQTWIVTAYTLTSTALIPAFGQLADIFGRHSTLQLILGCMTVGSILCTAAPAWGVLLLGRALQGVAAAGLASVVPVILADRVSLRENAKNNSIIQFFSGTAYCYGPVMGGYLTNSNWRWCFVISIPISVFASAATFFLLRKEVVQGTHSMLRSPLAGLATVDVIGTFTFVLGICLVILATTWGGATYSWASAAVLVPLVVGSVMLIGFPAYERQLQPGRVMKKRLPRQSAMIPTFLFSNLDCVWLSIIQFATGAALYSIFYYLAIFYIIVEGNTPAKAGLRLLWYIAGIGTGVVLAGFNCNKWPGSTFWPIFLGTWAETIGIGLTAWGIHTERNKVLIGMTILAGYGTGTRFMPVGLHVTGIWPERRAQALSFMRFALPFGGTIALAIMGSVFNNELAELGGSFNAGSVSPFSAFSRTAASQTDVLAGLPDDVKKAIRASAKKGVTLAFLSILPILGLSTLVSLLLGNVWINERPEVTDGVAANGADKVPSQQVEEKQEAVQSIEEPSAIVSAPAASGSFVLSEPYLWALFRGRKYMERKRKHWQPS